MAHAWNSSSLATCLGAVTAMLRCGGASDCHTPCVAAHLHTCMVDAAAGATTFLSYPRLCQCCSHLRFLRLSLHVPPLALALPPLAHLLPLSYSFLLPPSFSTPRQHLEELDKKIAEVDQSGVDYIERMGRLLEKYKIPLPSVTVRIALGGVL